jgi:hypothetical protein
MSTNLPNIDGLSLDNPHIDKKVNAGTTAANCQPRHTRMAMSLHDDYDDDDDDDDEEEDSSEDDTNDSNSSTTGGGSITTESTSRKKLSRAEKKRLKREKTAAAAAAAAAAAKRKKDSAEDPKKIGYLQMAKMGYQELVNAIIRPPRADYKVS